MEISTDMKEVKNSRCFGIAYDGDVKECKICEVASLCKQKTLGSTRKAPATPVKKADISSTESKVDTMKPTNPRPEPKATGTNETDEKKTDAKAKKAPAKKTDAKFADDMPDFKPMSVEELMELAQKRGIDPADFDKYTNVAIKKMRVTMALKKTYEVK